MDFYRNKENIMNNIWKCIKITITKITIGTESFEFIALSIMVNMYFISVRF